MAISEAITKRTRLRCEVAIPSGLRHGRMFVRLRQAEPGVLELLPARSFGDATHQIVNVWTRPLITQIAEEDPAVSGEMLRTGLWEQAESLALLWLARPGMTFVDAGATFGYYSALLAHTLLETGQVYAFEPEPRNSMMLTANALLMRQLFPQMAPIDVFPFALGDRVGHARLNVFEQNSAMHSLVHSGKEPVFPKDVPLFALDALANDPGESAIRRPVGLLKADVRGSELSLLRGASRIVEQDRPILCLRFEPLSNGADACIALAEWLRQMGYNRFKLFHAAAGESYQAIVDAVPTWTAAELIDQVHRRTIGPQGSIIAYADADPHLPRPTTEMASPSETR